MSVAFGAPAWAQTATGDISGTVADSTGAVLPGADVTAINVDTGVERHSVTDESGFFLFSTVPPGTFLVRVGMPGFSNHEQRGVQVNVGRTSALRIVLRLAGVAETVTVEGAPLIDTRKTDVSTLVGRLQLENLPTIGRRGDQFALLAAGVTRDGPFGQLSYRGQSGSFNNYMLEGNDDNQAYYAEATGRVRIASSISLNALQEFQVATGSFLPEYGRSSGGGYNAVIRSGGNEFHGEAFYFFQNQAMIARDPLSSIKPDSKRQQFGGGLGGPIVKNKAFFFVNYDQELRNFPLIIEDLSGVLTRGLPANPTEADLQAWEAGTTFLRGRFPNGAPGNAIPRFRDQNLFLTKVDYRLNSANSLAVSYNYLNARSKPGIQSALVLGNVGRNGSDDVRTHTVNASLTTTFSPRTLNQIRFHVSRDHNWQFADEPPPQVFVGGFSFGKATFLDRWAEPDERRIQVANILSHAVGNHSLKFGVDINRARDIIEGDQEFQGSYSYANALNFGRDLLNPAGRHWSSFAQNFGLARIDFATVDYAFFAQDQWRVLPNFTLNYGLRYDYQHNPDPPNPNPEFPETSQINRDRTNFGPRIGVAWDVMGDGKTVVRGGYGIYYGRTPNGTIGGAIRFTGLSDPDKSTVRFAMGPNNPAAPMFPDILPSIPEGQGGASLRLLDSDYQRPRIQDSSLGIERQLTQNTVISVSYVRTKGDRIPMQIDPNLPAPQFVRTYQLPDGSTFEVPFSAGVIRTAEGVPQSVNLSRPRPDFGSLNMLVSIGENWYNGMLLELRRRYANNFQFNLAYTLAKAESLAGSGGGGGSARETAFGGGTPPDQFNLRDRGNSPTDQRHRLVLNGVADLPFGFRVSGIYTAESGRPVSAIISVPNIPFVLDGVRYNGFGGLRGQGGGDDRNVAPNITRNSHFGEANYRLDFRLSKDFRLSEGRVLEVLGEAMNIFNRSNFNGFRSTFYEATGTTVNTPLEQPIVLRERDDFLVPNDNRTPPDGSGARRFQFSVKLRF